MVRSSICDMLNIEIPIIQGGMAWVSDASLAAAVSNAGGLGVIAAGNAPGDWVREEIKKAKTLTTKPFAVNIMLLSPYVEEVVKIVCEEGVQVVITGAGNPGKYIDMWKKHDITVIPVVPSVTLARRVERIGVDAVIAEGGEAGGHIGELTTMTLVPQVVDALNIPVIAAGGIADGRGVAAALMLGAKGVQVGTRFLVAKECTIHENYKKRVIKAKDTDSVVTGRSTGHPVRVLKNKLVREMKNLEKNHAPVEALEALGRGALYRAAREGNMDTGSVMAGQSAGLVHKEQSSEEILDELVSEAKDVIKSLKQVF